MPTAFRLTRRTGGAIGDGSTLDELIALAKASPPGHYWIEEISLNAVTGDLRCWVWGELIKKPDGTIMLDLPPWID